MAFGSKFGGVSASSRYVRVGEWGLAFCAYEGWAMFSLAFVDVDTPCNLQGVSSGPVLGVEVRTYGVIHS